MNEISTPDVPLQFDIGQPVVRTEDARLLTGGGNYTDDTNIDGQVYARFTRSQNCFDTLRTKIPCTAARPPQQTRASAA